MLVNRSLLPTEEVTVSSVWDEYKEIFSPTKYTVDYIHTYIDIVKHACKIKPKILYSITSRNNASLLIRD